MALPDELKKQIEALKDDADAKSMVSEILGLAEKTADVEIARRWLDTPDGKRHLQAATDVELRKAIETWKSNNVEKLVQEKYDELHPAEDPREKQIRDLTARLDAQEKQSLRKDLRLKTLSALTEKGVPTDLTDYIIGDDETSTDANIETITRLWGDKLSESVEAEVQKRLKGLSSKSPSKHEDANENPWSKSTFNLTKQGKILTENPELAKKLQAEAKR